MMHLIKRMFFAALLALSAGAASAQDRAQVVTVNYPLQYMAERLLGDTADVVFPIPADVDPSFWRPSIADISMIQSADLILLNGAGFASWIDRVSLPRSKLINTSAGITDQFIVTESITHSHGDGGEHSHEGLASYTWLDPTLAASQAQAIADAITARDLAPASEVNNRLEDLIADLGTLDANTALRLLDAKGVAMIATHPRYQYFARRYDLSMASLEWDAGAMPDESQIADLSALVQKTGAQILIWEALPPAAAFEMTGALGLRNVVFAPLANGNQDRSFIDAFANAVSELADAGMQ